MDRPVRRVVSRFEIKQRPYEKEAGLVKLKDRSRYGSVKTGATSYMDKLIN
jgi:hypothetical protein